MTSQLASSARFSCSVSRVVAIAVVAIASARAQDPGQRVPPTAFGPAVVETMADVVARERLAAASPAVPDLAGCWFVPPQELATGARSGSRYVANQWGDPCMSFAFERAVAFEGAWIAGHGPRESWAPAVRFVGFRDGKVVGDSGWSTALAAAPRWLGAGFGAVDRVEVQARPAVGDAAWFALDDLSFKLDGARTVLDFEDLPWRTTLTGTTYGGVRWERGARRGSSVVVGAVHAPAGVDARDSAAATASAVSLPLGPPAPHITASFNGPQMFGWIPPDSCGAAGLDHFVSIVNANLSVWTKSTAQRVVDVSLGSFWNVTGGIGDPRIVFDPHSQRFLALAMDGPAGNIHFAVSLTSDPTGAWFKTSFVAGVLPGEWADAPRLGVDVRGVYISALIVGANSSTVWAFDKAPLIAANPSIGTVTAWRNLTWEGGPQPCVTYGDPGVEYVVSALHRAALRVRAIRPPLTAPTMVNFGAVLLPVTNDRAPGAPALGSTVPLASGDTRLANAVFRHGSIWTAQTADVSARAACRWYELGTAGGTLSLAQVGTIDDPVRHFFYPSIAVNALGDVVLGFSGSHAGEYAGSWVTGRLAGDPPGTTATPELLFAGEGAYQLLDGNGANRYGDYSMTSVDPTDELGFWTIQEHTGPNNAWRTRIARVEYDWIEYGVGHAGTLSVPQTTVVGRPVLGSLIGLRTTNSLGAATRGALLLGADAAAIPVLGGTLLVTPSIAIDIGIAVPSSLTLLSIPNDPGLLRQSVYLQVVEIDGGASHGVSFTPGLQMRIGR